MTDEGVQQKYRRAFDFLSRKGITELRSYGRAFGVRAPTAKHKSELIGDIIKIAAGLEPKLPQTNKGARVRAKPVTPDEMEELRRMVQEKAESSPRSSEEDIFLKAGQGTYTLRGKLDIRTNGSFRLSLEGDMEKS